ncbi:ArsR/SmtB family transcription factor [Phaeobacter inhibens]|uniref:ArsR/SmtB family transcription factor n=1 Tax=Phaeobacter inhibens TaxID=221822 RepID=UPI000C9A795E|nr:putative HTH-type transcriptional regulator, ArsR family [Phaeobacter inhibens]AUR06304.1 putative HTH-type transcriptional regulator, ArsR family [Phaeobacter inhibens]AUR10113.1 putative HTH-type transcriptional regulator, ArsR family [Phaeobacter inhibens]
MFMSTPRFDILGQALADASRTRMLCELLDGRSYTNKELASAAGVTPPTATAHLQMLQSAGLVVSEKRGRCVFHRLASAEVAHTLEQLAAIAPSDHLHRAQQRKAGQLAPLRSCYDHFAGPLAVAMTARFIELGLLVERNGGFEVIPATEWDRLGVVLPGRPGRQPFARPCMDWTERRLHISGPLGRQLLSHALDTGWVKRQSVKRGLLLTTPGRAAFEQIVGLDTRSVVPELSSS